MNTPSETPDWPIIIDRQHRHIRTDTGSTVIPFDLIGLMASIAAVLIGLETTFGITNWASIPVCILAIGWAIERIDHASVRHQHRNDSTRDEDNNQPRDRP